MVVEGVAHTRVASSASEFVDIGHVVVVLVVSVEVQKCLVDCTLVVEVVVEVPVQSYSVAELPVDRIHPTFAFHTDWRTGHTGSPQRGEVELALVFS